MYDGQLYEAGVHSVLLVEWTLTCVTPLAIRNGVKVAFSNRDDPKTRYLHPGLQWRTATDRPPGPPRRGETTESELAALCYRCEVVNGQLQVVHYLPASSVRGALRSWTVRNLVEPAAGQALMPPLKLKREEASEADRQAAEVRAQAQLETLARSLDEQSQGTQLIASLFGLAAETTETAALSSNAGRLQVETKYEPKKTALAVSGRGVEVLGGPKLGRRQLTVRSPIDRVSGSARDGGLHHFLEFARGEQFTVHLRITNPCDADVALAYLWQREIDDGLLRFGALSSVGRGRMRVEAPSVTLWQHPTAPRLDEQARFRPQQDPAAPDEDALAGLWQRSILPPAEMRHFTRRLEPYTGGASHA